MIFANSPKKKNGSSRQKPAIPEGLMDILPAQARRRRLLESRLRGAFENRGFGEVICPTFEFYDLLAIEAGSSVKRDMVRFMGGDGRLLSLRPEMTTAIARVVAQRLDPADEPHRLYYLANVFREHQGRQSQPREFWQAGVEQVGGGGLRDDLEVVGLFIEALESAGLTGFQVGLGRIDFLDGSLRALEIPESDRECLRSALAARSLVDYRSAVGGLNVDDRIADRLLALPTLRGGAEILETAADLAIGDEAQAAVERIAELLTLLKGEGLADRLIIDLGIVRDFDYYTGMVFEAYLPGLGTPVGGGGRYDNLLAEFGYPAPAAGFAFGIEKLERALAAPSKGTSKEIER
jgi:ATP phosphoribosyltransferase regulatory subunit